MFGLSDNMLFLIGIIVIGCALLGSVVAFLVLKIREAKLKATLDTEYGSEL